MPLQDTAEQSSRTSWARWKKHQAAESLVSRQHEAMQRTEQMDRQEKQVKDERYL